jgi:hypothetical protein
MGGNKSRGDDSEVIILIPNWHSYSRISPRMIITGAVFIILPIDKCAKKV